MNTETKIPNNVRTFYAQYAVYALRTEQQTGISHLFILAQAALESGWGAHAPAYMFFGVKATTHTPIHKRQLLVTTEVLSAPPKPNDFPDVIGVTPLPNGKYLCVVKDWFRKYASPEECFTEHARLLLTHKRYAPALKVKADPYAFADAIARAGYATDPQYAEKLKKIIGKLERLAGKLGSNTADSLPKIPVFALVPLLMGVFLLVSCKAKKEVYRHEQQLAQEQLTDSLIGQQAIWQSQNQLLSSLQEFTAEVESFKDSVGRSYLRLHSVRHQQQQAVDSLIQQEAHHQWHTRSQTDSLSSFRYAEKQHEGSPHWLWWLLGVGILCVLVRKK